MNYRTETVIGWVDKRRGGRSGRCSGVGEGRRWDGARKRDEVIEIHWEIQERERHKDTKVKTRGKEVKLKKK